MVTLNFYVQQKLIQFTQKLIQRNHDYFWVFFLEVKLDITKSRCGLFSNLHYRFRSSPSTADLLTVISNKIVGDFNRTVATLAVALDISKVFDWGLACWSSSRLSLIEFQVRYLALFCLFWVIHGFAWYWMGSLQKNILLMLEFLKAPFLVLQFSYYTLMNFLMMLSVILLSMLMVLLSTLSEIRHLICGNN